ncbi:hypothetical protein NA57DRAFT_61342 [Rhizodiscina lignyota]|uniref:Uncharacterized protein n=1 Tax=Rhizodiscina lignyota TaxID=1504668 RepID=A0A9P4I261_9PEZI|nr:hypothetical protein NA57DRAFT_61342 [Rhizodiscina lignyota]
MYIVPEYLCVRSSYLRAITLTMPEEISIGDSRTLQTPKITGDSYRNYLRFPGLKTLDQDFEGAISSERRSCGSRSPGIWRAGAFWRFAPSNPLRCAPNKERRGGPHETRHPFTTTTFNHPPPASIFRDIDARRGRLSQKWSCATERKLLGEKQKVSDRFYREPQRHTNIGHRFGLDPLTLQKPVRLDATPTTPVYEQLCYAIQGGCITTLSGAELPRPAKIGALHSPKISVESSNTRLAAAINAQKARYFQTPPAAHVRVTSARGKKRRFDVSAKIDSEWPIGRGCFQTPLHASLLCQSVAVLGDPLESVPRFW